MRTIKQQTLSYIVENGNEMQRKNVIEFITKTNGSRKREFCRGYYCTNFLAWDTEGLIVRENGKYKVTALGKRYVKNPSIIQAENLKRKVKKLQKVSELGHAYYIEYKTLERSVKEMNEYIDLLQWDFDRMSLSGQKVFIQLIEKMQKL